MPVSSIAFGLVADDVHGMYYTPLSYFLFFHATKG